MIENIPQKRKNPYVGISYFKILQNRPVKWIWKKFFCKKGRHLLDEVWSPGGEHYNDHYLVCDACQLVINIKSISGEYVDKK